MPTATHRILLALALAVGTSGCAFFGSLVHGGTVAAGAGVGSAVAGPAGAIVGGVAGFYGGDLAAEQITGTRSVRINEAGKVLPPAGASLTGAVSQATGLPTMNLDNISLVLLAGLIYAIMEVRKLRKEVDELYDNKADKTK